MTFFHENDVVTGRSVLSRKIKSGVALDGVQLSAKFDLPQYDDGNKKQIDGSAQLIGQDRALNAIELSAGIADNNFNMFVLGPSGYGKHTAVQNALSKHAAGKSVPSDWIYVNNFADPGSPIAIELPAGMAGRFKTAMGELVNDLANEIPAIFEGEDYQNRRRAIEQEYEDANEQAFSNLIKDASEKGLAVLRTPMGFGIIAKKDDRNLTATEFNQLPTAEKERIDNLIRAQQIELENVLKDIPKREKERRRQVEDLNAEMAREGVEESILVLLNEFGKIKKLRQHLKAVESDLIENAELFLLTDPTLNVGAFPISTGKHYKAPQFNRYGVNVMVSNPDQTERGAPVVTQELPTLSNLVGRTEYTSEMGTLKTDFTMIKPGDLHKANGGYLVLDARQVLMEPFAWEALKRCLKSEEIAIVSAAERYSLVTTKSLEPDPIPLKVRVVLVGDRSLYYLLMAYDPDFRALFKVPADFSNAIDCSPKSTRLYAGLIRQMAGDNSVMPIDAAGIERLLVESTRLSNDNGKFSLNFGKISDILKEADYWAKRRHGKEIGSPDIDKAIREFEKRESRIRNLTLEAINKDMLLIDTKGSKAGQINALSVLQIGGARFGKPSRITCRVRMGKGRVLDIEREVELGGPLHSKGVLILSGYIAANYALDVPLSLSATIVFEQSYGGVDGDSASAAELFAMLSALSGLPIDQSLAVTGSVNQNGEIQAIGGVNEKIEGFFDVCKGKGLTGSQGVIIPKANVKSLALRQRVIEAVNQNKFSIIPIDNIGQGMELLTGSRFGKRGRSGTFPKNSVNGLVEARLLHFADNLKAFAQKK